MDVLVTQHSKWTAKRVRRALFGQSLVDFSNDPWESVKSQKESTQPEIQQKPTKKPSRIERAFSQTQSEFSQTQEESSQTQRDSQIVGNNNNAELREQEPTVEVPDGT